jgi:hypothetical protein
MILLAGIPSEPPLAMLKTRLDEIGVPYVLFNQREARRARLRWSMSGGRLDGTFMVDGRAHDLRGLDAVYARLMDDRMLPELEDEPIGSPVRLSTRRLHELLIQWVDIAPGRVVNRFRNMGSNGSKPYQAQLIRRSGLNVPETIVTNDPERLAGFRARHGRVVFKSISGIRSIVTELAEDEELDAQRMEALAACPVQFQAYVPGYDVRVHVIGSQAIATRVDSDGTDYRYASRSGFETDLRAWEVDPEVAGSCVRLTSDLGLAFAGIDLRVTPDGVVYCFEVNPSPAYSYYEANAGQPIAMALARFLAGQAD